MKKISGIAFLLYCATLIAAPALAQFKHRFVNRFSAITDQNNSITVIVNPGTIDNTLGVPGIQHSFDESLCRGSEGERVAKLRNELTLIIINLERTGSRDLSQYQKSILEGAPACERFGRYLRQIKELVSEGDPEPIPENSAYITDFNSSYGRLVAKLNTGDTLTAKSNGGYYGTSEYGSLVVGKRYVTATAGLEFIKFGPNVYDSTEPRTEKRSCLITERYQDCYWQHDRVTDRITQVCEDKTRYVNGTRTVVFNSGTRTTSTSIWVQKSSRTVAEFAESYDEAIDDRYGSSGDCLKSH